MGYIYDKMLILPIVKDLQIIISDFSRDKDIWGFWNWTMDLLILASDLAYNPDMLQESYKERLVDLIKDGIRFSNGNLDPYVYANMLDYVINYYSIHLLTYNQPLSDDCDVVSMDSININILIKTKKDQHAYT